MEKWSETPAGTSCAQTYQTASHSVHVQPKCVRCVGVGGFNQKHMLCPSAAHSALPVLRLICTFALSLFALLLNSAVFPPVFFNHLLYVSLIPSPGLQGLHGKCTSTCCTVPLFLCLQSVFRQRFLPSGTQTMGHYAILTCSSSAFSFTLSHPARHTRTAPGFSVRSWHLHALPRRLQWSLVIGPRFPAVHANKQMHHWDRHTVSFQTSLQKEINAWGLNV